MSFEWIIGTAIGLAGLVLGYLQLRVAHLSSALKVASTSPAPLATPVQRYVDTSDIVVGYLPAARMSLSSLNFDARMDEKLRASRRRTGVPKSDRPELNLFGLDAADVPKEIPSFAVEALRPLPSRLNVRDGDVLWFRAHVANEGSELQGRTLLAIASFRELRGVKGFIVRSYVSRRSVSAGKAEHFIMRGSDELKRFARELKNVLAVESAAEGVMLEYLNPSESAFLHVIVTVRVSRFLHRVTLKSVAPAVAVYALHLHPGYASQYDVATPAASE
jgi:hypothetical protein